MSSGKNLIDFMTLVEMNENERAELIEVLSDLIIKKNVFELNEFMEDSENTRYLTEDEQDWLRGLIKSLNGKERLN